MLRAEVDAVADVDRRDRSKGFRQCADIGTIREAENFDPHSLSARLHANSPQDIIDFVMGGAGIDKRTNALALRWPSVQDRVGRISAGRARHSGCR